MSIFKSIGKVGKGILDVVAPTIASALPGPIGPLAKKVVTDLLGLDAEASEAEIEKTLASANPEMLERLRKLDADFRVQMKQLDIDFEKILSEDRASARARHIAVRDRMPPILAVFTWTSVVAVMGALFFYVPPGPNKDMLLVLLGILVGQAKDIGGYYFGSSSGSARKTEMLNGGGK